MAVQRSKTATTAIALCCDISCLMIMLWIMRKIFSNLYKCRSFCLAFSDWHNWIMEPSTWNKINVFVSVSCYVIAFALFVILDVALLSNKVTDEFYNKYGVIPCIIIIFGHVFYYFTLITRIKFQMNSNDLINKMISNKYIIIIKFLTIVGGITAIAYYWLRFESNFKSKIDGIDYMLICYIGMIIFAISVDLCLMRLYYCGWSEVCRYNASRYYEEFEKYGENERIHEIRIRMTRFFVVISVAIFVNSIDYIWGILYTYCIINHLDQNNSLMLFLITDSITRVGWIFTLISEAITIYFIYEFAHTDYEKICKRCNNFAKQVQKMEDPLLLNDETGNET